MAELGPRTPPHARPPRRPAFGALLRNREFARVFAAGLGSTAGITIGAVCMTWIVASTTRSVLDVGILGAANVVTSILCSVFGGALVDRHDPRRLMILSDLARAAVTGGAAVDLGALGFNLSVLVAVYAAIGGFGTVFNPAENALVPRLVNGPAVADANGLIRSSRSALGFAGAGLGGGLIFAAGPLWGLAVNVATYVASAALLSGLRPSPRPLAHVVESAGARPGYMASLSEGFRWLRGARGFLELTASATFFNFCSTFVGAFLVFFATDLLGGSSLTFGLLLAAEVAGTGIGALLVGPLRAVGWFGLAWTVPYGVVSGGVALALALAPSVPGAIAELFALGLLGGFAGTAWLSGAQLLVPPEMLGRYFGIDNLGSVAILPAAQLGGAVLIATAGLRSSYVLVAVAWIAAGTMFLLPRALRELGRNPGSTGV